MSETLAIPKVYHELISMNSEAIQQESRRLMAKAGISAPEGIFWPLLWNIYRDEYELCSQQSLDRHTMTAGSYGELMRAFGTVRAAQAEKQDNVTRNYLPEARGRD